MESRVGPRDSVFRITSTWSRHLVECSNSVSYFELRHIAADGVNNSSDVVTLVYLRACPLGDFPVFGIRPADNDFDYHLIFVWGRDN